MEKVNERVIWRMDGETNDIWEKETKTKKTIVEEVLMKSKGKIVDKNT